MKQWTLAAGVVLALLAAGVWWHAGTSSEPDTVLDLTHQPEVSIVLGKTGYAPDTIRVTKGTRVIFSTTESAAYWPASNAHPDHTIYPQFDPKEPVAASSTWSFVFDRVGTWAFHDHLQSYLTGTIYVVE